MPITRKWQDCAKRSQGCPQLETHSSHIVEKAKGCSSNVFKQGYHRPSLGTVPLFAPCGTSKRASKPVTSIRYRGRSCTFNRNVVLLARAILSPSTNVAKPEQSIYGTPVRSMVNAR